MRGHASGATSEKDGDAKPEADEAAREELLNALAAAQDGGEEQEP
jgi:hypothetical protein